MISPVVVFITKYTAIATMLTNFVTGNYPSYVKVEVADSIENVKEIIPFRVLVLVDEGVCGEMIRSSKYPGKLRLIHRETVESDFEQIMKEEGINKITVEESDK